MRNVRFAHMMCAMVVGLTAFNAHGYISIRSQSNGATVQWPRGSQLVFRVNTTNRSGLAAQSIFQIFTTSLNRWKQAAFGGFSFVYYQGTDSNRYPNYTGSVSDNSIFFTSNASQNDQLPCGVIGLTEVWFDPGNGSASKADIRFNDVCYQFTLNPSDTSTQQRIYLGDVATHELGHALGLDHSQNLQSTQIYTAAVEMATPSCDDQAAMIALYGGSASGSAGTITGTVQSASGSGIFGAHVTAISLERGVAVASALTEQNGSFRIGGLEPGKYSIMAEPFYPGASALGPYYSGINNDVCNGSKFKRTFLKEGSTLKTLNVSANHEVYAGTITTSCSEPGSSFANAEANFGNAPTINNQNVDTPIGVQGTFTTGVSSHFYKLENVSGRISVAALGYTLFSPADVYVDLLDENGVRLTQNTYPDIFSSSSGYVNFDSSSTADLQSGQDVYVRVYRASSNISTSAYPSRSIGVAAVPYYVLTVSRGKTGGLYPNNARCAAVDSFGTYSSLGEAPPLQAKGSGSSEDSGSMGCGTLRNIDSDPGSPGNMIRIMNLAFMLALLLMGRRVLSTKLILQ